MKLRDISALGRPIDPAYPTNRAILALSAVVMVVGALVQFFGGGEWLESAAWGAGAGLTVFLAWALGRELDPDHELSAFVGAALVLPGLLFFDLPSFLVVLWLLMALRTVNRTGGQPAKLLDTLAVLGLGGWLAWQGNWVAGLMTAAVFLLDGLLPAPQRMHLLASGLALASLAMILIVGEGRAMGGGATWPVLVSSVAAGFLFLLVIAGSREVRAVGDATGDRLIARRVQAAQALALITGLLLVVWEGVPGMVALLPLWAAMVGVSGYRLASIVQARLKGTPRTEPGTQETP
jgi:hypothetical protein